MTAVCLCVCVWEGGHASPTRKGVVSTDDTHRRNDSYIQTQSLPYTTDTGTPATMLHVLRRRPQSSCLLQQTVVRATRCCPSPNVNIITILLRHASSTLTRTPGGLSVLRTESAAATVPAILEEAEAAWQRQQREGPATMRVLLLHDELEDDVEAMESNVPTLGATAERNQLLDTDMVTGAKEGDDKEPPPAAATTKAELPSPLDDPTTATCISVGVPNVEEIVLFRSHDASFPTLRRKGSASATGATDVSSSLAEMVMQKQPRFLLLFAEPQFPLAELSSRLESIFDKSHVMAAYARAVLPALRPPRILALGGGDTPAPADDSTSSSNSSSSSSSSGSTPQAVGLALFGENALSTEDVGRLACSLFGSSWLGNFSLDERLTRHLFVPSNITLGKQPPCRKYQALEETHAHDLPLFRLHSVLFPGCSLMLKIFEPRYVRTLSREEMIVFFGYFLGIKSHAFAFFSFETFYRAMPFSHSHPSFSPSLSPSLPPSSILSLGTGGWSSGPWSGMSRLAF